MARQPPVHDCSYWQNASRFIAEEYIGADNSSRRHIRYLIAVGIILVFLSYPVVAQFGRALAMGARGRRFKTCLSDQCRIRAASMFSTPSVKETAAGYSAEPLCAQLVQLAGHRFRSPEIGVRVACCAYHAGLAQLAEHLFCSQGVMGSSPLFGSMAAHSRPVLSPYRHIPRVVHSFYCVVHPYGELPYSTGKTLLVYRRRTHLS